MQAGKTERDILRWLEDRTGLGARLRALAEHRVPRRAKWAYVFGSATLAALFIQMVTGVALATVYASSTSEAHASLRYITHQAPFGSWVRGMHYFGASAMVALVLAHLVRVYLSGSYKFPRELTWLIGALLLLLTLGMGFTGQLLRWDQNAVWTLVVGAEQAGRVPAIGKTLGRLLLGGTTLNVGTLPRFFALHVFVLPGLLFAGIGLHLYLVLRHGVSEPPRAGRPVDPRTYRSWYERLLRCDGVPFWPNAAWRDLVFGSVVVGAVVALGWAVGPPGLGRPPDPSVINAEPRPDWYFLPYFALLALMPHSLEPFVIVLGPLVLGVVLVSVPLLAHRGERSPKRRPWAPMIVLGAATVLTALGVAGMKADWSPRFDAKPLPAALVAPSDPRVNRGAALFARRGCIYCHAISTHGGRRGPNLTHVGSLLTRDQMVIRILNGGYNMPGYGAILQADEVDALIGFLQSRR